MNAKNLRAENRQGITALTNNRDDRNINLDYTKNAKDRAALI
jgi:hypothetical protein